MAAGALGAPSIPTLGKADNVSDLGCPYHSPRSHVPGLGLSLVNFARSMVVSSPALLGAERWSRPQASAHSL